MLTTHDWCAGENKQGISVSIDLGTRDGVDFRIDLANVVDC